jgi:hypothetical protein
MWLWSRDRLQHNPKAEEEDLTGSFTGDQRKRDDAFKSYVRFVCQPDRSSSHFVVNIQGYHTLGTLSFSLTLTPGISIDFEGLAPTFKAHCWLLYKDTQVRAA